MPRLAPKMPMAAILALAAIVALALALRLYDIGIGLHSDEIHVIGWAFGEGLVFPQNAQGYLPILKASISILGRNELGARLPGAVLAVTTVILTFLVGRRRFGNAAGLFAALVLATSTLHIAMSQWVHTYALLALVGLLVFHHFLEAADRGRARHWLLLGFWSGAAILSHHFGIFVLFATIAALAVLVATGSVRKPQPRWLPIAAAAMTLAVAAPVLLQVAVPVSDLLKRVLGGGQGGIVSAPEPLFEIDLALFAQLAGQLAVTWAHSPILAWAFWLSTAVGLLQLARKSRAKALAILTWWIVPLPLTTLFSYYTHMTIQSRRLIFLVPPLAVIAGFGIAEISRWTRRPLARLSAPPWLGETAVVLAAGALFLPPLGDFYRNRAAWESHWREVTGFLEEVMEPTDVIVGWPLHSLKFYRPGDDELRLAATWSPLDPADDRSQNRRVWLALEHSFPNYFPHPARILDDWAAANQPLRLDFGPIHTVVGVGRGAGERTAERAALVRAAVDRLPQSCALRRTLAQALGEIGRIDEALREYSHPSCGAAGPRLDQQLQARRCEWTAIADPGAAVDCYDDLVALRSGPSAAQLGRARALRARGDLEAAEESFRLAIAGPSAEAAARELAWMLAEDGRGEEAIAVVSAAENRVPSRGKLRLNLTRAQLLIRRLAFDEARTALARGVGAASDPIDWRTVVAQLYSGSGQLHSAAEDFRQLAAATSSPSPALAGLTAELERSRLARALLTGRIEAASSLLRDSAPDLRCELADEATLLARELLSRGKLLRRSDAAAASRSAFKASAEMLDRIADCGPLAEPRLLLQLGRHLSDSGEHREAIDQLERLQDLEVSRWLETEGSANLCLAYRRAGELRSAVKACRGALERDPDHYYSLVHLAASHLALSEWSEAVDSASRAIRSAANERQRTRGLTLTARAHAGAGDPSEACRVLQRLDDAAKKRDLPRRLAAELSCELQPGTASPRS